MKWMRSHAFRFIAGFLAVYAVIVACRLHALDKARPHWEEDIHRSGVKGARRTLEVGFIPVTCHLTCPVTDYASQTSTTGTAFDAIRFAEFPPIVEALKTKKLLAGFVTVPLGIRMVEQGAPVKICALGHRDGSCLVVRSDQDIRSLADLRGKSIAIPSPFSNENFFMHKMIRDQGHKPEEFTFLALPPSDMGASLAARAIDSYIVAEPYCAKSELDGSGKILYYAKDIWPNYMSCCLVVHKDLIAESREVVADLVRGICESGEWTERNRVDAAKLVAPYFRQDVELLRYVLTADPARVTYRNLSPTDAEIEKIRDMGMELGFIKKLVTVDDILDRSFIPSMIPPAQIDLSRMSEIVPKEAATSKPTTATPAAPPAK